MHMAHRIQHLNLMKQFRSKYLLSFLTCLCLGTSAFAQPQAKEAMPIVGCMDPVVRQQAEQIKQHYIAQGFTTYRDAMVNMTSMDAVPVMIQLIKGQLYEIIYVGQPAGTNHKLVLLDGNDHQIAEEYVHKKKGELPANYLIYEFTPERTDTYLLMVGTRLKNKDFCGSLSVLAADSTKAGVAFKPYEPK